jgi:hypothetical protein
MQNLVEFVQNFKFGICYRIWNNWLQNVSAEKVDRCSGIQEVKLQLQYFYILMFVDLLAILHNIDMHDKYNVA